MKAIQQVYTLPMIPAWRANPREADAYQVRLSAEVLSWLVTYVKTWFHVVEAKVDAGLEPEGTKAVRYELCIAFVSQGDFLRFAHEWLPLEEGNAPVVKPGGPRTANNGKPYPRRR